MFAQIWITLCLLSNPVNTSPQIDHSQVLTTCLCIHSALAFWLQYIMGMCTYVMQTCWVHVKILRCWWKWASEGHRLTPSVSGQNWLIVAQLL